MIGIPIKQGERFTVKLKFGDVIDERTIWRAPHDLIMQPWMIDTIEKMGNLRLFVNGVRMLALVRDEK